jgi:hypothetical protein
MVLLTLLLFLSSAPAAAHDLWIGQGRYHDPVTGELCCGKVDCGVWQRNAGESITLRSDGYHVDATFLVDFGEGGMPFHLHEIVPQNQAQPSPDGEFWACVTWRNTHATRRCFFAPPPNS